MVAADVNPAVYRHFAAEVILEVFDIYAVHVGKK
jgi:hypothetical protein